MLFWASMQKAFHWLHWVVRIKHILFSFRSPPHSTHTLSSALHIRSDFWFLICLLVCQLFYHENNCNNECCLCLPPAFCSFFLFVNFPFAALPPRFLSMTPGENWSGDITLSIAFCPFFSLYFSSVLSCILSLFISFLFSGVLFPVLSRHLCERSSTLGVWIAGLWKMDLTCIQRSATSAHF